MYLCIRSPNTYKNDVSHLDILINFKENFFEDNTSLFHYVLTTVNLKCNHQQTSRWGTHGKYNVIANDYIKALEKKRNILSPKLYTHAYSSYLLLNRWLQSCFIKWFALLRKYKPNYQNQNHGTHWTYIPSNFKSPLFYRFNKIIT